MNKEELELYSWILRGKQRRSILKSLNKPKIPTQIKDDTKLSLNNVSDILRLFVSKGIAKCLNEKEKTGRIYKLTKLGDKIRKIILES